MKKFFQLPEHERRAIFTQASNSLGLPPQAIEKDLWVTLALKAIFTSEVRNHFVFKGGTSLSKAFRLIHRFSEDVDLSVDRQFLGFDGELSKGQLRKLRRACHAFVSTEFKQFIQRQFEYLGVEPDDCVFAVENVDITDKDPEILSISYPSVFDSIQYLSNNIKLEVGARSLKEPFESVQVCSMIHELFPVIDSAEASFAVNAVSPGKTFLEKLILLHEEFQKPEEKIRSFRMSRHFYDLDQILQTPFGQEAIRNTPLLESILEHRSRFTPVRNVDYASLDFGTLNIVPPPSVVANFISDYQEMQNSMILGQSKPLLQIIDELQLALRG